jgi:hypothetical protein
MIGKHYHFTALRLNKYESINFNGEKYKNVYASGSELIISECQCKPHAGLEKLICAYWT